MGRKSKKILKNIQQTLHSQSVDSRSLHNSYSGLTQDMVKKTMGKPQNSSLGMSLDSIYDFSTLDRMSLAYLYLHNPIVSVVVNKPVQDALRGGITLKCEGLGSETNNFLNLLDNEGIFEEVRNAFFWSRLFGGAALLINQENAEPLDPFKISSIRRGEKIEFYALDRWQIQTFSHINPNVLDSETQEIWRVGTQSIHNSRLIPIKNKEVPSMLRGTFQNWGVSEVERMRREMNTYLKAQNVLFELVDEAKVDVFSIEGLNDAFSDPTLKQAVHERIWTAAQLKSYLNALIMDKNDSYESKSVNFSGMKDVNVDARTGISIASGIPQDHWAGTGASGFSSGEDTIERYNAMIESDVRRDMKKVWNEIIRIKMQQYYGVVYKFEVGFYPLRVLGANMEETIKNSQQTRIERLFKAGLIERKTVDEFLDKHSLLGV